MTGFLILILALCALMLVPCVIAAADVQLDVRISVGGTAPMAAARATSAPASHRPNAPAPTAASQAIALYTNRSIRMENALRQLTQALDRIAACNDRQAALVARNTLRRLKSGEAPITGLTEFARQRLELIALGQERKAARIAAQALQQAQ